ncbi:MAG: hypothetical protein BIFFINMI_00235 [Phycisphaerae bacterium]|nr:hypothetical protein [Phycisphaerae bacterium]
MTATMLHVLIGLALAGGFYMAWTIGANDVANAFGTSVGSGALTIRRAVLLAAVFEFAGAFFVGGKVSTTIASKIIDVGVFNAHSPDAVTFGIGMLAALLGSAIWLTVATWMGQPVSTTHAIIGAVMGFGLVQVGGSCVQWHKMSTIVASWIVSPIVGGILAYMIYRWTIRRYVLQARHPVYRAMRVMPVAMGFLASVIAFSIVFQGLKGLRLNFTLRQAILTAGGIGVAVAVLAWLPIRGRMKRHHVRRAERYAVIERWFGFMQIPTACFMSFAHGANDVANAIGPLAAAIQIFREGKLSGEIQSLGLLAFGGVGIVIGLATYGYKVIAAIGKKITEITPTRGFSAELSTATTVIVFSKLGMPISTTFVIVGAVMGVGFARGFGAIDMKVIRRIFASWVITIPASAVLGAGIFKLLMMLVH